MVARRGRGQKRQCLPPCTMHGFEPHAVAARCQATEGQAQLKVTLSWRAATHLVCQCQPQLHLPSQLRERPLLLQRLLQQQYGGGVLPPLVRQLPPTKLYSTSLPLAAELLSALR